MRREFFEIGFKLGVPWGYVVSMLERYKRVARSAEERPVHLSALIR
jgi:hypothetical protein